MAYGNQQMKMSRQGLEMLMRLEGCKQEAYKDVAGYLTIGVGHKMTGEEIESGLIHGKVSWVGGLSLEQCYEVLALDVDVAEQTVAMETEVLLKQYEFDALVSLTYNIGRDAYLKSTLRRKLNDGKKAEVPQEMRRWIKAGGKTVRGLKLRREDEVAMWLGQNEDTHVADLCKRFETWNV